VKPARAAIVTGGSSGIGLAIARVLQDEGFALTVAARRPDKLEAAAESLRGHGNVEAVAGDLSSEQAVQQVVDRHRRRFGRLDVLVNNAGVGIGAPLGEIDTRRMDTQIELNLRTPILFYREALDMLRAAGAEHRNAWVINTASMSAKRAEPWISVYSAAKHGIVGFTHSMNRELASEGIKSCALCPGLVDTPLAESAKASVPDKASVPAEEMISAEDVAESVRYLLRLSSACVVPELMFTRPARPF
jgi:NAD(P)-dependent dehydrogenase (short-subunit alcohol dehydrogenase family)